MTEAKFKITFGQIKAAARITHSRDDLKRHNFFPAETFEGSDLAAAGAPDHRLPDGSGNDKRRPRLGQTGRPFSRNSPKSAILEHQDIYNPDPRVVSQRLLHNPDGGQKLAPGINLLCAAWIQFQVHDWFNHEVDPEKSLKLAATESQAALTLAATREQGRMMDDEIPSFGNTQGHWWDASQIYGASEAVTQLLRRSDEGLLTAELRLADDAELLPTGAPHPDHGVDSTTVELSGFVQNWWLGLSAIHTLFVHEHNAVVAHLRKNTRRADGRPAVADVQGVEDWLFGKARLVVSALIAKIHTVEWTPALLDDPVMKLGLYADWWGKGAEDAGRLFDLFGAFASSKGLADDDYLTAEHIEEMATYPAVPKDIIDVLRGLFVEGRIPDRVTPASYELGLDHKPLDYAISEEFVAVYRMHPLLADPVPLIRGDGSVDPVPLTHVSLARTRQTMEALGLEGALRSLVFGAPAALRLRNFPSTLAKFRQAGAEREVDLGAVDILRDRERGIPRYAAFKEFVIQYLGPTLDDPPSTRPRSFADICGDPAAPGIDGVEQARRLRDAELLAQVYNSPDDVDLLVGLLCEPLPPGFAFSWTAFEVFLLMAVLRLSVDRFFTTDYTAATYTQAGIDWINGNGFRDVLQRHTPDLADQLRETGMDGLPANPFCAENWAR